MDRNHLHNFERGPTKDHSCEVWSKSNQWFRRRCCLKIVNGQTDGRRRRWRRTVSDHKSSPWAFGSGELTSGAKRFYEISHYWQVKDMTWVWRECSRNSLMLSMLGKNFQQTAFWNIFSSFFPKNQALTFNAKCLLNVSLFSGKNKKIFVICWICSESDKC